MDIKTRIIESPQEIQGSVLVEGRWINFEGICCPVPVFISAFLLTGTKFTVRNISEREEMSLAVSEVETAIYSELCCGNEAYLAKYSKKTNGIRMTVLDTETKLEVEADRANSVLKDAAVSACLLMKAIGESDELTRNISAFKNAVINNVDDLQSSINLLYVNYSSRLKSDAIKLSIPKTGSITRLNIGSVLGSSMTPAAGEFQVFGTGRNKPVEIESIDENEVKSKFILNPERIFSEDEKKMMFEIPAFYDFSSNVVSVADKVKKSWDRAPHLRKTNILFEGPAGTGKTMDAKVLSALLGVPYTKVTCFSDMDSSDVTGSILPVAEETKKAPEVPDDLDIELDPVGSYEQVTGKTVDDISAEDVRAAIEQKLKEYYESTEGQNSPEYIYYASEIVKAFEGGWLCEVQEPTCIADAAVLLVLNSALEKDGIINLPQRVAKRNPETIFVFTTNRNYEGCRPLNEALRDRFNIVKNMQMPSEKEIAERLQKFTGCKNLKFCIDVAKIANSLNDKLESMGIRANASFRGLSDFVVDVMDGYSIDSSFDEDVVFKITTDEEDLAEIRTMLETSTPLYGLSL